MRFFFCLLLGILEVLIRSGSEHRLGAVLGAGAAALSAGGEARPSGELAVDGASEPVASHGIDERSTRVAPPQEAWARIERVLVPMVPQVLVQVVQPGPPRREHCRQRATEPVARLDLGEGGGSEIAVGSKGNVGASLGLVVPIVPQVLEQTLKPDQPEALASTEQVL